jgi:hypothetical protein
MTADYLLRIECTHVRLGSQYMYACTSAPTDVRVHSITRTHAIRDMPVFDNSTTSCITPSSMHFLFDASLVFGCLLTYVPCESSVNECILYTGTKMIPINALAGCMCANNKYTPMTPRSRFTAVMLTPRPPHRNESIKYHCGINHTDTMPRKPRGLGWTSPWTRRKHVDTTTRPTTNHQSPLVVYGPSKSTAAVFSPQTKHFHMVTGRHWREQVAVDERTTHNHAEYFNLCYVYSSDSDLDSPVHTPMRIRRRPGNLCIPSFVNVSRVCVC